MERLESPRRLTEAGFLASLKGGRMKNNDVYIPGWYSAGNTIRKYRSK